MPPAGPSAASPRSAPSSWSGCLRSEPACLLSFDPAVRLRLRCALRIPRGRFGGLECRVPRHRDPRRLWNDLPQDLQLQLFQSRVDQAIEHVASKRLVNSVSAVAMSCRLTLTLTRSKPCLKVILALSGSDRGRQSIFHEKSSSLVSVNPS